MAERKEIIKIEQLLGTKKYLDLVPEARNELCKKIIVTSIGKMTIQAPREVQVEIMKQLFQNSLEYYEKEELYENCIIFRDLIQELTNG